MRLRRKRPEIESSDSEVEISKKKSPKKTKVVDEEDDGNSSDSSIGEYLQSPDKIDLDLPFFNVEKTESVPSFAAIERSIFRGVKTLDDNESESESENEATTAATAASTSHENKRKINFQQLNDYEKKSKPIDDDARPNVEPEDADISDLLAIGEARNRELRTNEIDDSDSDSNESEMENWEEVKNDETAEAAPSSSDKAIKDGVQITVALPSLMRHKRGIDLMASMKRRLNRIKKENQTFVHKTHLLCWIAHGNYVNSVLNDNNILGTALSLLPSEQCYPSSRTDLNYLEQIVKWYTRNVKLNEKPTTDNCTLEDSLKLDMSKKEASSKKMLVYIFVCILRSLGIQCRFVFNFQVVSLRPPSSELCSLSTKTDSKKDTTKNAENQGEKSCARDENESDVKKVDDADSSSSKVLSKALEKKKDEKDTTTKASAVNTKKDSKTKSSIANTKRQSASTNRKVKTSSSRAKGSSSTRSANKLASSTKKESKSIVDANLRSASVSGTKINADVHRQPINKLTKTSLKDKIDLVAKVVLNKLPDEKNCSLATKQSKIEMIKTYAKPTLRLLANDVKSVAAVAQQSKIECVSDYAKNKRSPKDNKDTKVNIGSESLNKTNSVRSIKLKSSSKLDGLQATTREKSAAGGGTKATASTSKTDAERKKDKPNLASLLKPIRIKKPTKGTGKKQAANKKNARTKSAKTKCAATVTVPQVDGPLDDDSSTTCSKKKSKVKKSQSNKPDSGTEATKKYSQRKRTTVKYVQPDEDDNSDEEFMPRSPSKSVDSKYFSPKCVDVRGDIVNLIKGRINERKHMDRSKKVESKKNIKKESSDDSDYAPEAVRKKYNSDSGEEFIEKSATKVKRRIPAKPESRKVLSSDSDAEQDQKPEVKRKGNDIWLEVFLESEERWISVDVTKGQVHCVSEIYSRASTPVAYIVGWNNNHTLKDITRRYCPQWNTVTRKLRTDSSWWDESLKPFLGPKNARDREEDEELMKQQLEQPLPKVISEYKNHPLYVLKRHLLKFEALYPPEPITLGFIRGEAVYARECVHTLHSREIWVKSAKVVRLGEKPYKIVKARPKYDRLTRNVTTDLPLEIFGPWQVDDYVPPVAENGIVPRNAYGNVELFKTCMLPKGTIHLQLAGLSKVARKMNIDCASAVVGFEYKSGGSYPTYDGYVVCEEFADQLVAAWFVEQEEAEIRAKEKMEKRVYGNWKKLIRGLKIRERLKVKYNFDVPSTSTENTGGKAKIKRKAVGVKVLAKKRRVGSDSETGCSASD